MRYYLTLAVLLCVLHVNSALSQNFPGVGAGGGGAGAGNPFANPVVNSVEKLEILHPHGETVLLPEVVDLAMRMEVQGNILSERSLSFKIRVGAEVEIERNGLNSEVTIKRWSQLASVDDISFKIPAGIYTSEDPLKLSDKPEDWEKIKPPFVFRKVNTRGGNWMLGRFHEVILCENDEIVPSGSRPKGVNGVDPGSFLVPFWGY